MARVAPLGPAFGVTPQQADSFYDDLMSGAFEGDDEEAYVPHSAPSAHPPSNVSMRSARTSISHDDL